MDWLEELANRRRAQSVTYEVTEVQVEAEDGGYEIEVVCDGEGNPLTSPVLIAAGDKKGVFHI